jgi:hypothetical protein
MITNEICKRFEILFQVEIISNLTLGSANKLGVGHENWW